MRRLKKNPDSKQEDWDANEGFIHLKNMGDRPKEIHQVDAEPNVVHFVLTGWKKQYNLGARDSGGRHLRYIKIPYSSHSSF